MTRMVAGDRDIESASLMGIPPPLVFAFWFVKDESVIISELCVLFSEMGGDIRTIGCALDWIIVVVVYDARQDVKVVLEERQGERQKKRYVGVRKQRRADFKGFYAH